MLVVVSLMLIFTTINTNMNNAKKDSEIKQLQNQIVEIKQLQTQVEYLQDRNFILGVIVEKGDLKYTHISSVSMESQVLIALRWFQMFFLVLMSWLLRHLTLKAR